MQEAFVWYEAQATGLGADFLRGVASVEAQLSREPASYVAVRGQIRRAVLRKFPYVLFYSKEPTEVAVLACFHHCSHPRRWPAG